MGERGLRREDWWWLALGCVLMFGAPLATGRLLTGHESVVPQNSREMIADGDWLVPKVGGQAWLERPPLPDWVTGAVYAVLGAPSDRVARVPAMLAGLAVVLMVASLAARWHGRAVGIVAGLILASTQEMRIFGADPEADIFLCAIVTAALYLFARSEIPSSADARPEGVFGGRPMTVLWFFAALGLTNHAKGLIFGTAMAAIPVAGFLLWNARAAQIRRYAWAWGWLAFAAVSLAWPAAVCLRHPEVVGLWQDHYLGRLNKGYIGEPWHYYLTAVLYVMAPWTLLALAGVVRTLRPAWNGNNSPERFQLCWALLPLSLFSIPDGKHHHYLIYSMAPWAIVAARAAVDGWAWLANAPRVRAALWATAILAAVAGDAAIWAFRHKLKGTEWVLPAALCLWPVAVLTLTWGSTRRGPTLAVVGTFGSVAAFYLVGTVYATQYQDDYNDDYAFLQRAAQVAPPSEPLFVQFDHCRPLETFWVLFHTPRPGTVVQNAEQLFDRPDRPDTLYLLARRLDLPGLVPFAEVETVLTSDHTRCEGSPDERRVLVRVRFRGERPVNAQPPTRALLW